jgi:hypothetical protein
VVRERATTRSCHSSFFLEVFMGVLIFNAGCRAQCACSHESFRDGLPGRVVLPSSEIILSNEGSYDRKISHGFERRDFP